MAKDYTCWDCGYYGGRHEPTCPRKGYMRPNEPKAPAPAAPARVECPCGIHREDCDYHRPSAAPTYEYGAYDCTAFSKTETFVVDWSDCGPAWAWQAYDFHPWTGNFRLVAEVWP